VGGEGERYTLGCGCGGGGGEARESRRRRGLVESGASIGVKGGGEGVRDAGRDNGGQAREMWGAATEGLECGKGGGGVAVHASHENRQWTCM
jgi:hypothetical protein